MTDDTSSAAADDGAVGNAFAQHLTGAIFACLLAGLGLVCMAMSFDYGMNTETNPIGPGAFPAALGALLVLGAAGILAGEIRGLVRIRRADDAAAAEPGRLGRATASFARARLLRPFGVILFLGAGLAVSPVIGMVPGLTLSVLGIALVIERMRLSRALILGVVTVLMLWLIFGQLLSVNFPKSLIGL